MTRNRLTGLNIRLDSTRSRKWANFNLDSWREVNYTENSACAVATIRPRTHIARFEEVGPTTEKKRRFSRNPDSCPPWRKTTTSKCLLLPITAAAIRSVILTGGKIFHLLSCASRNLFISTCGYDSR